MGVWELSVPSLKLVCNSKIILKYKVKKKKKKKGRTSRAGAQLWRARAVEADSRGAGPRMGEAREGLARGRPGRVGDAAASLWGWPRAAACPQLESAAEVPKAGEPAAQSQSQEAGRGQPGN